MKYTMKIIALVLLASVSIILFPACKATLESGGAYAPVGTNGAAVVQPDITFYTTDQAYQTAWMTVNAVFTFERDNRIYLWKVSPNIKHTLDGIRPQAVKADSDYIVARAEYLRNPVPTNLTTLNTILAKMNQLVLAAQAILPK